MASLEPISGIIIDPSPQHPRWMQDQMKNFGLHYMREIILPASHDAGMCTQLEGQKTVFGTPDLTMTQDKTIKQQLEGGIRYLDIRPIMGRPGVFYCGHYTELEAVRSLVEVFQWMKDAPPIIPFYEDVRRLGGTLEQLIAWQGGCSTPMNDLITDVNAFLRENNELVVLDISGWGGFTDCVSESHRDLNEAEWQELYQQLSYIEKLYKPTSEAGRDLKNLTMMDLIGYPKPSGKCVIINNPRGEKYIGRHLYQGFFPRECWFEKRPEDNGKGFRYLDGCRYFSKVPSTEACIWQVLRYTDNAQLFGDFIDFWNTRIPNDIKPYFMAKFVLEMNLNENRYFPGVFKDAVYRNPELLKTVKHTDMMNGGESRLRMISIDAVGSCDLPAKVIELNLQRFS